MVLASWLAAHHLQKPVQVVSIVVVSAALVFFARRIVRRSVNAFVFVRNKTGAAGRADRANRRAKTLSSVTGSALAGIIWTSALVSVLQVAGVNVGALVTAASIVAGALAFGAQQLVRDLLAGLFVIGEDQYGVGDIVDLGVATGVVERLTLKTTSLRDVQGRLWHVPNGNVVRAGNLSQQWSQAVLDVPIERDADPAQASAILERIATEMRAEVGWSDKIADEPKVLGVEDLLDDRLVLRLTVRTEPAVQIDVQRELRKRILHAWRSGELHLMRTRHPIKDMSPPTNL